MSIQVNVDLLETTSTFPYLVGNIVLNNKNWMDTYYNLRKANQKWGMVANVLVIAGETVRV